AYELTPEGIKKESEVDRSRSVVGETGRKLDRIIIGFLVLAVAYFVYERQTIKSESQVLETAQTAQQQGTPEVASEPSIAVLPFADLSPDKDQEYFSDGIAEELLNLLVRVDGLKVASRTSSFTYKGNLLSLSEIADELKVDHILEGSVRKAGNRVRITAQLIDAATDRHLWSDTYDRELTDIFGIQDDIANAIVDALRSELGVLQEMGTVSAEVVTDNLDAYELYLKARGLFLARAELPTAVSLFERAVELDPEFARAWQDLAAVYSVMESWGHIDRDYNQLALQAAQKALELDPGLSTPWAVMGQVATDSGDMLSGLINMSKAIDLDPENPTHYLWRGIDFSTLGFQEQSIADLEKCLELDPAYENCRRHLAYSHVLLGNYETGFEYFQEGAERGFSGANNWFIAPLVRMGKRDLATQLLWSDEEIGSLLPGKAILDAIEFPTRDHSRGLARLDAFVESTGYAPRWYSMLYAILGAYSRVEPDPGFPRWVWMDELSDFRHSEYFADYASELGLTAYWRANGFPPACRAVGDDGIECD
ncbi:MAG: hypothetical protein KJO85_05900, partial [Gammaproteobacteria bacterium]|nr:hypothetical protein [Gammaproteobacteria bacterium]